MSGSGPTPAPDGRMPRNVVALGFTSLFTDVSTEMLIPILPLFITATLGASATSLGIIEGVAECVASVLRTTSGWLSDRIGRRKPFLVLGYGLSGAAKAAIGLAAGWTTVLGLRVADRLGKGLRNPPRDALIADSVPRESLGRAFGLHRAMDTAGAAIGPLLAWALLGHWRALGVAGYRRIFFVSAVPAALSLLVLLLFVRAPRHAPAPRRTLAEHRAALGGLFARFVAIDTLFALANSSNAFVLLRADHAGWSAAGVALLYAGFNIVMAALAYPFGHLSDRVGRRPLLIAGYLLYAVVYAGLAAPPTRWGMVAAFALLGAHTALVDGQARSLIARIIPAGSRATAFGAHATVTGLALLPASALAGWLWDHHGPGMMFLVDAILALVAAVALMTTLPSREETPA